ncbi:uncharacterized protein PGTG_08337 [Puccinia graminis f. sp. tritici CRL 75-36-700-3]|uniref:Uncharacterized protein n=1 Tax=Puccinia graminis f. sp. tritici (strain CRL 75-36-700-3 / race SCCL) TaxID=418459 RepID=E3KE24_PUCGT|nr:uncharacterized protein PGTG_08337 [Puccinia graminis f. sp. tritici CRL 75-36-700-3]EFP82381.1 hypothetical protein PGTG_08337 [Puccinia graminis f. sp. tritici CRL 75-36-700-3]
MASMTESTSSNQATVDRVLDALEALARKYHYGARSEANGFIPKGEEKEELTEEEVEQRHERLNELRSKLLPSLKDHVNGISTSLNNLANNSSSDPDFGSTLKSIEQLVQITTKAIKLNFSLFWEAPLPSNTHDYQLKESKIYRTEDLYTSTCCLESSRSSLLEHGVDFIKSWKTSTHNRPITNHYMKLTPRERLLETTTSYDALIDKIIRASQVSELTFLQECWRDTSKHFADALKRLAVLTGPNRKNKSVLRRDIVTLAKATTPLIKLLRILYMKISTNQFEFRLNTEEINSKTLSLLHGDPPTIKFRCDVHACSLEDIHKANSICSIDKQFLVERIHDISRTIDYTVLLLALHLVPLPPCKIDPSLRHTRDFKTWLFSWQNHWTLAKTNLLRLISSVNLL